MRENNLKKLTTPLLMFIYALIMMIISLLLQRLLNDNDNIYSTLLFGLSFLLGGFYKAVEGIKETIENKALNVEILMILAALAAFVIGDFMEGAILILIFSMSGILEDYATSKSENSITSLLKLQPKIAILYEDGHERVIDLDLLKVGDIVIVKKGMQVPSDSILINNPSSFDESAITGEFNISFKDVNDKLLSGIINVGDTVLTKVIKSPKESTLQKMIDLVTKAQEEKTISQSKLDMFEKYYVYIIILFAILFMFIPPLIGWLDQKESFYRGAVILVVGSPCALMASTMPAYLSAMSSAARKKILIKGGKKLEKVDQIKTIMFDKTGTLTKGKYQVRKLVSIEDENIELSKRLIYSLESVSNHPIAKSIINYYQNKVVPITLNNIKEFPGIGIEGIIDNDIYQVGRFDKDICEYIKDINLKGETIIPLIKNKKLMAYIILTDELKENAIETVNNLKKLNKTIVLASGDREIVVKNMALDTKIENYYYNLMPSDKVSLVKKYKKSIGDVMMIGDGLNDAPALASSSLGVSMASGVDVSIETSDIVIMNNDLENIVYLFKLSKKLKSIILFNIIFSISVIIALLISNLFGVIKLPLGVVFHEMSTILVIINSLRLLLK